MPSPNETVRFLHPLRGRHRTLQIVPIASHPMRCPISISAIPFPSALPTSPFREGFGKYPEGRPRDEIRDAATDAARSEWVYKMFLHKIGDERYVVRIGHHYEGKPGRWLFFARTDRIGRMRAVCHYACEIADPFTRHIVIRWFMARRDRWQNWGEKVEAIGPERFAIYMKALMAAEPLEEVVGIEVNFASDWRSISIGEILVDAHGRRTEIMFGHRFMSREAGKRLYHWLKTGHNAKRSALFVKLGYSEGGEALGAYLDRLAANEIEKPAIGGPGTGYRPASGRYN